MIDFVNVGIKISTLRKGFNMSQEDLANQLFVTRQALSKWENGTSIPSIDTLIELSKIFKVSFEEILCLNDNGIIEVDPNDIFSGHERNYVINRIIENSLVVNLPEIFYQLSPSERMLILKNIKGGVIKTNIEELWVRLTISEQRYLGGKNYEIQKSNY